MKQVNKCPPPSLWTTANYISLHIEGFAPRVYSRGQSSMIFDLYLYSSDLVVALRLLPVTLYPNPLMHGKQMIFILSKLKAAKVGTLPLKSQIIVASSYIPHAAPRQFMSFSLSSGPRYAYSRFSNFALRHIND